MIKKITFIGLISIISVVGLAFVFFPELFIQTSQINLNFSDKSTQKSLSIPSLLEDLNPEDGISEFKLTVQNGQVNFIDDKLTKTLGYNGNYLGPVIKVDRYDLVNITVDNQLDDSTSVHWHGLEVDGPADGGPFQVIPSKSLWNPSFVVDQVASTLWFHPHVMGTTATQVYQGLAGLFIVEDENSKSLNLPDKYGVNDIPLIIQDRAFDANGQFIYINSMDGAIGNRFIVNGSIYPYLDVDQMKVRFRIVNGANARNYNLHLSDNSSFYQIASDGGLLESPVEMDNLFLAPGERAEIIIDFSKYSKGDQITLLTEDKALIDFNIQNEVNDTSVIPDHLADFENIDLSKVTKTKSIELDAMGMFVAIDGQQFDPLRIDTTVNQFEYQIWEISVNSGMMSTPGHPFHVHSTQFRILDRNGQAPNENEAGWKDTVYVRNGETVRILVQFKHKGIFMYHCHILEHEEAGMMAQLQVY